MSEIYLIIQNTGPKMNVEMRPITPDEDVELYSNEEVVGVIDRGGDADE